MASSAPLRFLLKIEPNDEDCWVWAACRDHKGYGLFQYDGRLQPARRVSYQMFFGPIPEAHDLDHLCRVRACVNPAHLEAVSRAENIKRGETGKWQTAKASCPRGHQYGPANTYVSPEGHRRCRECMRAADARRRTKK